MHVRKRHDELAAALEELRLALEELVEEVPRQREVVVGRRRPRLLLRDDRDGGADRLRAPLVRVAVGRALDETRVEPGVLQDRVALGRRAVDVDASCPRRARRSSSAQQVVADALGRRARSARRAPASRAPARTRSTRRSCSSACRCSRPLQAGRGGRRRGGSAAVDVVELGARRPPGPRSASSRSITASE